MNINGGVNMTRFNCCLVRKMSSLVLAVACWLIVQTDAKASVYTLDYANVAIGGTAADSTSYAVEDRVAVHAPEQMTQSSTNYSMVNALSNEMTQVWLDVNYGDSQRGSPSQPFRTLSGAVERVEGGGTVQLVTTRITEATRITKPVTLRKTETAPGGDALAAQSTEISEEGETEVSTLSVGTSAEDVAARAESQESKSSDQDLAENDETIELDNNQNAATRWLEYQ